jgi:hypothetical protein
VSEHQGAGPACACVHAPIPVIPTPEARDALGVQLRPAALKAHRQIALATKGLEIAYHQFAFGTLTLAVCSRVRRDGLTEIEIGLGDPRLPQTTFTAAQLQNADRQRRR